MEVFPLVFYRPFESFDPGSKDGYEDFLFDFAENVCDCQFEPLSVRDVLLSEFFLEITEEEEVTWCCVGTVRRLRYPFHLSSAQTFAGSFRIVWTCIVQVDVATFQ
jgi:hypothetical protein